MNNKSALDCFNEFVQIIAPTTTPKDRLFVVSGIIELLRRTSNENVTYGMAQLLAEAPAMPWQNIPFSVTQEVLGHKYDAIVSDREQLPDVLLRSLLVFLDFVQNGAELSEEVFKAIVQSVAADMVSKKVAPPELFKPALALRSFAPQQVSDKTFKTLQADAVLYRGELPGAKLGPDIRGVAFDNGTNTSHIILETGEYVRTPLKALNVAGVVNTDDFKTLPANLLLSMTAVASDLFLAAIVTAKQEQALSTLGCFGKITAQHHKVVVASKDLQPLEHVFESGRDTAFMGVTGPSGATVRFPVAGTDMVVVIDARQSNSGPYCVSRLVRVNQAGDDEIIMRHDTPRLFTSKGIYIFPTKDNGLVSLTCIY